MGRSGFQLGKFGRIQIAAKRFEQLDLCPHLLPVELLQVKCTRTRLPRIDFRVQRITNGAIKRIGVSALEHDAQIVAVGPVLLGTELLPHTLVETRVGQRVGK
jgi:hypothetical protein